MAPDIEELIKKVNTLTLDKNRLRQKLAQLGQNGNQQTDAANLLLNQSPITQQNAHNNHHQLQHQSSSSDSYDPSSTTKSSKYSPTNSANIINKSPGELSSSSTKCSNVIAGVECLTSCEEDLLFMNDLYRKRLEEYNENWDYIQSKCSALLSELNALQEHYALLKKEKSNLELKYQAKCDDCDATKSELQTVVTNYETQLSTMSEHLSMITSQIRLEDSDVLWPH